MHHKDFSALRPASTKDNQDKGQENKALVCWWLERWIDRYGPLEWTPGLVHSLCDVAGITKGDTVEGHLKALTAPMSPYAPFFIEERGFGKEQQSFIHRKTPEMLAEDEAELVALGVVPPPQDSKQPPQRGRSQQGKRGDDA